MGDIFHPGSGYLMRPRTDLLVKLSRAMRAEPDDLLKALAGWPGEAAQPCWDGERKVFHGGRPRQTLRLLVELATGREVPSDMRLRTRLCPRPGCLNPHHYRLVPYVTWQERVGLVQRDLTSTAATMMEDADDEAGDFVDICELIAGADGGRHRSANDLHAQWPMYERELIARALASLNENEPS